MTSEEGFTLVEVLIATVLGAIVIGVVATVVVTGNATLKFALDTFGGDNDVQLVLTHLTADVRAAVPDAALSASGAKTVNAFDVPNPSAPGDQLTLTVATSNKLLRVMYLYDPLKGTITRTVTDGTVTQTLEVAHRLQLNAVDVFDYCASSNSDCPPDNHRGPRLMATLPFLVNGNVLTRTVRIATQVKTP